MYTKAPTRFPILNYTNPFHTILPYSLKIYFRHNSPIYAFIVQVVFLSAFLTENYVYISIISHRLHIQFMCHYLYFGHPNVNLCHVQIMKLHITVVVLPCFLMCGCVYVWVLKCLGVCICGFCNVWVCVCVGFVMFGCVYVWVL
jgi:hypothetical protein